MHFVQTDQTTLLVWVDMNQWCSGELGKKENWQPEMCGLSLTKKAVLWGIGAVWCAPLV